MAPILAYVLRKTNRSNSAFTCKALCNQSAPKLPKAWGGGCGSRRQESFLERRQEVPFHHENACPSGYGQGRSAVEVRSKKKLFEVAELGP